nr:uncharacterized protein LOC122272414 [Parasteatoda tepidariorum]
MSAELSKRKQKRGAVRASTTRLFGEIEHEIKNEIPNIETLDELLAKLIEKESLLKELDLKIEDLIEVDEIEKEYEQSEEYSDKIIVLKTKISRILSSSSAKWLNRVSDPSGDELHCFCDASKSAYGATIYLISASSTSRSSQLVIAKSRVSPLKQLSLPKLELMAAVIGTRMIASIRDQFPESRIFMWTDSTITLHWIRGSPRKWKRFVSNRVTEIQQRSDPSQWNHCPGSDNPADKLTREGIEASALVQDDVWWHGPPWLICSRNEWPATDDSQFSLTDDVQTEIMTVSFIAGADPDPVLKVENFSTLRKLLHVTSYIFRFIKNLRSCVKQNGTITSTELNPKLDENKILRIKSRLANSSLDVSEKCPIILPNNDYFVALIIKDCHERVLHAGVNDTLLLIRSKFWIVKGRQFVKSVIYRCKICRRFSVTSGKQVTGNLPVDRIEKSPPFNITGIDFAGPLYLRDGSKCYIALFTCAVTRGVHLELVSSLKVESFIQALRRFFGRRGICKIIYSDNAKTFKAADREIKYLFKLCKNDELLQYLEKQGIEWKFIVEGAPWWGGFWERLANIPGLMDWITP